MHFDGLDLGHVLGDRLLRQNGAVLLRLELFHERFAPLLPPVLNILRSLQFLLTNIEIFGETGHLLITIFD